MVFTGADRTLLHVINAKLDFLLTKEEAQMANIQALQDAVAQQTTVVQSIVTLLDGIAQQLRDAGSDPEAIDAVIDALEANTQSLAEAVARNTTAAEEEAPNV
jgi:hypothetical protein